MAADETAPVTGTGQKRRPAKAAGAAGKAPTKAARATRATSATKAARATKTANGAKATANGAKATRATKIVGATKAARVSGTKATKAAPARKTPARRSPASPKPAPPVPDSLKLIKEAAQRLAADEVAAPSPVRRVLPARVERVAPVDPPPPPPAPLVQERPSAPHPPAPLDIYLPIVAPKKSRRGLIAAIVIGGLALAGGGVGVLLATRDRAPSKSEYLASADAICGPANAPVAALVKPTSYPELSTAAATLASTAKGQADKLRGLDRPGGADRVQIDAVLTWLDKTGQAAELVQGAATSGHDAGVVSATKEMNGAFGSANAAASTYGFGACATGMKSGVDALSGGSQVIIKTVFVAKADTVCRAGARELEAIPEPGSATRFAQALDEVAAIADRMQAELGTLPVPPGDESTVAEMLSAQAKVNAKGHEIADSVRARDASAFEAAMREIDILTTAADAKWDAYGLGSCGTNFGES